MLPKARQHARQPCIPAHLPMATLQRLRAQEPVQRTLRRALPQLPYPVEAGVEEGCVAPRAQLCTLAQQDRRGGRSGVSRQRVQRQRARNQWWLGSHTAALQRCSGAHLWQ